MRHMPRIKDMTYAILTLLFTATFLISPAFTSFSGFSADLLPIPQIDPPIQPAGYAFSIWGLIYLWLGFSAIFGIFKRAEDDAWNAARPYLIASLALGTPWLYIATQNAIAATVVIIAMAIFAIAALLHAPRLSGRWTFQAPVAIYAGWLTAASAVSLSSTAAGYGVVFGSVGWAYAGITLALMVALAVFARRPSAPEYLLTVVWALVGIIVANQAATQSVAIFAGLGIAIILATLLWSRFSAPARRVS